MGETMTQPEIEEWKKSGVYHEMFSKGDVVVPEHIEDAHDLVTKGAIALPTLLHEGAPKVPDLPSRLSA